MGAGVNRPVHVPTPSPACTLARARSLAPCKRPDLPRDFTQTSRFASLNLSMQRCIGRAGHRSRSLTTQLEKCYV